MATPNRSALIARTLKVIRKHYKPVAQPKDRSVLEHLLFACLLEDSPQEAAEQVFQALKHDYFGWNEVRVSTIRELTDALKPLVPPGSSLPDLALRFILHHPAVSTTIPGMRSLGHVASNIAASDAPPLGADLIDALRAHRWERNWQVP